MNTQKMRALLESLPGAVGFWAEDTATGEVFRFNPDVPVVAASVIKLFVMAEAFRQAEAGTLNLDEEVTIREEDKLPSCGALTYMHTGLRVRIIDLITLMIIVSDNTATNLMIDRVGQSEINALIDKYGFAGCDLQRKLWQPELSRQGYQNHVTAAACASFFHLLLRGELVSPAASRRMLDILSDQRLNGKMPFYLHSKGIKCAHKTGEDDGITHDVGVIWAKAPRIFCFVSEKTDVPSAERALQDLALLCAED